MLFSVNGRWVLITEGGHDGRYPGMHLEASAPNGVYTLRPPEPDEVKGLFPAFEPQAPPWTHPWRILIVGDSLAKVVESNLVTHVAEPSRLGGDLSWIRPGRASWSWWSDGRSPRDFSKLKTFVDFAAEMGWEYSLVDAGWPDMQGGDIEALAAYAASKNVGLLLWYDSGARSIGEDDHPRRLMWDRDRRRAEFARLQGLGIRGVKIDFLQSDKPVMIRQYLEILEDAADHHLVVNFHGCTLPRGWRRTYPNLLTMEAIRGGEFYRFDRKYPEVAPAHTVIAACTRNVVGPVDYTPVALSNNRYPRLTTSGFELAQAVVLESGIQHFCDDAASYRALPAFALTFLQEVPVAWEETRFVAGQPEAHVVLARRSEDRWYIGGLSGLDHPLALALDLGFLEKSGRLHLITTEETDDRLRETEVTVAPGQAFQLKLKPRDGFVGWID